MAPRSHWNGYLKLSLVSCPIALYPAISAAERVSFRQVNRQTGNRLKQQLVDSVTGEVVQSDDKGRGYQIGENQLLLVEDEELEAARHEARARPYSAAPISRMLPPSDIPERTAAPEARPNKMERHRPKLDEADAAYEPMPVPVRVVNNRTIEVERCVPRAQIDPRYFDTPYYIAPRDEVGIEAFAVIRDAMRSKELVGMGHVVLAKRERPIIIEPMDNGLCGMTLRYTHEVRSAAEYFAGIPSLELPEEMLRVAEHILESKTTDFDPALLEDRYRTVLVSMLKEKQAELPKKPAKTMPPRQNVINLMDALKRSLVTERPIAKPKSRRKTSPSKSSGRK